MRLDGERTVTLVVGGKRIEHMDPALAEALAGPARAAGIKVEVVGAARRPLPRKEHG